MALKITLKPNERMIIGGAVICNGASKTEFLVENTVPILRRKDILSADNADSPARRIYFAIQLMYVDPDKITEHQRIYWQLVKDFVTAAPSSLVMIDQINELIISENYYQALKAARTLIEFEQEVIQRVTKCTQSLSVS
jgi:flagellar biosynthesis repressor protein FlbT